MTDEMDALPHLLSNGGYLALAQIGAPKRVLSRLIALTLDEDDGVGWQAATVLNFLRDASPQTRGMAAWCLGQLGQNGAIPELRKLSDDSATAICF